MADDITVAVGVVHALAGGGPYQTDCRGYVVRVGNGPRILARFSQAELKELLGVECQVWP
ncbi:MAG: hypothetical protein QM767_22765 [Anaeromyxobacter sp.]